MDCAAEERLLRLRLASWWYLLIETLAGHGRRVEALRARRLLRGVLAEVGVEAGDDLVSLEQEILQGHGIS